MRLVKVLFYCCLAIAPTAYGANLLVNGDFESPGAAYTADYRAIASNTLPGWTSAIGNGTGPNNYYSAKNSSADWIPNPQSGNYSVELDSSDTAGFYSTGGSLSQTVSLTANVPYVLTFYMSAETNTQSGGVPVSTTAQIDVILNGGGFTNQDMVNPATGTTGFRATATGAPKANPEVSWVQWSLTFTPTVSGNVTIKFLDVWVNNPASSNSSLDNIDLEAIPEMSHWSIFAAFAALAVGASIWATRRKQLIAARAPDKRHPSL